MMEKRAQQSPAGADSCQLGFFEARPSLPLSYEFPNLSEWKEMAF